MAKINLVIKILITEKEFEHYNNRKPKSRMDMFRYAEKVKNFIQNAIDEEDNRMTGGVFIRDWEEDNGKE